MSADNIVVANQGLNPLVNYNFMLRVEGIYDLPCKSVHGFQKENEYEDIQEGGLNDYVHIRRKPVTKPFTFQVERYVGIDYFDPIPNGAELILPVILLVSRIQNDFGRTKRAYVFTGCSVMSKSFGELNAEKSGLLVETSTISYREMMCMDMPVDISAKQWAFDGTNVEGNGERSARTLEEYGIYPPAEKAEYQKRFRMQDTKEEQKNNLSAKQVSDFGYRPKQDEKRRWPVKSARQISDFLNKTNG